MIKSFKIFESNNDFKIDNKSLYVLCGSPILDEVKEFLILYRDICSDTILKSKLSEFVEEIDNGYMRFYKNNIGMILIFGKRIGFEVFNYFSEGDDTNDVNLLFYINKDRYKDKNFIFLDIDDGVIKTISKDDFLHKLEIVGYSKKYNL